MSVKVLYFASLREHMLRGQDEIDLSADITTVERLKNYLSEKILFLKRLLKKCLV